MKKLVSVALVLVLAISLVAVASASIYGGVEKRIELRDANKGGHQIMGDQGGVFTATLNQTQEIYYVYDWDMNFFALADAVGGDVFYSDWGTAEAFAGGVSNNPKRGE